MEKSSSLSSYKLILRRSIMAIYYLVIEIHKDFLKLPTQEQQKNTR